MKKYFYKTKKERTKYQAKDYHGWLGDFIGVLLVVFILSFVIGVSVGFWTR